MDAENLKTRSAGEERFEARLLANVDALFNRAVDLTGSESVASDLVVETCMRAWRAFENDGPALPRKGWLFAILYTIAVSERGGKRLRAQDEAAKELELSESEDSDGWPGGGDEPPLLPAEFEWNGADIAALVDELPDELRSPLMLVDVDRLTYEDAARVLRCSVSAVGQRLFRARRAVCAKLGGIVRATANDGDKKFA